MPLPAEHLERRLDALRAMLQRRKIVSQKQLLDGLVGKGFEVTQASVSRDLQRIGAVKREGRYQLPEVSQHDQGTAEDEAALPALLIEDIRPAGPNLTIITTPAGGAAPLGVWIDRQQWPELVGTIAGDDTIFAATRNKIEQKSLIGRLRELANRGK